MGHKTLYLFAFIGALATAVPAAADDTAAEARGLTLPRSVEGLRTVGKPIPLRELRPGDLLFYNTRHRPYSHVGIYVGEGRFVHAPRPGARVRVEDIRKAYWRARFNGARHI